MAPFPLYGSRRMNSKYLPLFFSGITYPDRSEGTYVALKILTASTSAAGKEIEIHDTLSRSRVAHEGKKHVMILRDRFSHIGPNGTHQCLVFEVMGPSAAGMIESFPISNDRMAHCFRFPLFIAKSILQQTLLGLDFLHENGISHGDLQPGNILFPVRDLKAIGEAQLKQQHVDYTMLAQSGVNKKPDDYRAKRGISQPVRRLDGKLDEWAPRYLAYNQSLSNFAFFERGFEIKISDLGAAFFSDEPLEEAVTPFALRSPELIVTGQNTKEQDVWSFGCLLFEFLTGRPLFAVDSFTFGEESNDLEEAPTIQSLDPDSRDVNDDHMLQLTDILGPMPQNLRSQWRRSPIYFDDNGEIIKHHIGPLPEDCTAEEIRADATIPPLRQYFDELKPAEMSASEAEDVKDLLAWILQYDVSKRPSLSDLVQHKWYKVSEDEK